MTIDRNRKPTAEAQQEATQNPGGWVYEIEGSYDPDGAIPPEAILGAWKVNDAGEIEGDFIPNSNYQPGTEPDLD